jgi:hypothetical protein
VKATRKANMHLGSTFIASAAVGAAIFTTMTFGDRAAEEARNAQNGGDAGSVGVLNSDARLSSF